MLENEANKILQDFDIQLDHNIPPTRSKLEIVEKKKRTSQIADSEN